MSIETEIERLQNAKASLKTSLINKGVEVSDTAKLDEYPALVDSISTGEGGGSEGTSSAKALWCGGNNPVLVDSITKVINVANDTTYNSIIPSTSSQVIKSKEELLVVENIDLDNYDYVVIKKLISAVSYKDAPADINLIKNYANMSIYNLCRRYVNSLTTKTDNVSTLTSETGLLLQKSGAGDSYSSYGTGGIRPSSSNTPYYYQYGKSLTIDQEEIIAQANTTYMQQEAFNYLDAENSNITFIVEVYRVDKESPCSKKTNDVIEAILRGSFTEEV